MASNAKIPQLAPAENQNQNGAAEAGRASRLAGKT